MGNDKSKNSSLTPIKQVLELEKTSYTTAELAARLKVRPSTIRRGLCVNGHYMDLKPIKLPNGRLIWS